MANHAVALRRPTRSIKIVRSTSEQECARFDAWFDVTWKELSHTTFSPLSRLLKYPRFNPWFIFRGLYQCCDPTPERSTERRSSSTITISKQRLRAIKRDLDGAALLAEELATTISRLERATVNIRLEPALRAVPTSDDAKIRLEDLRELRARLSGWANRFAAKAKTVQPVINQRSFKPNADLIVLLYEHVREQAGSEATALFIPLLEAGYVGHHREIRLGSADLINLRRRFESNNGPIHTFLRGKSLRNSQLMENQPESERLPWRTGTPSDLTKLKNSFHQDF